MFTIKGVVYPEKISQSLERLRNEILDTEANAVATAANFSCGSFVRFSLAIDTKSRLVTNASFSSNGCGFMIAAADALAEAVSKRTLTDLSGLNDADLYNNIHDRLGEFPSNRQECVAAGIEALRAAFADHRKHQIEEFQGEKALICTCFGISEETIETLIAKDSLKTVDEVTGSCNAGGGCGSCRMLIQEMLDSYNAEEFVL